MIHVPREQTDASGAAIRPSNHWFDRAAAARLRAIAEDGDHEAERSIYADDELRAVLAAVFSDKCAYCEFSLLNCDWDVDHFRPKGRVAEAPGHPGYYWLAYEWTNLYPACERCNQHRRERQRWGESEPLRAGGKTDQFPLLDEGCRATHPDALLADEQPLLLDPCADNPESHLGYLPTGDITAADPRGAATIRVLFLDRRALRDLRRDVVEAVSGALRALAGIAHGTQAWHEIDAFVRRRCSASASFAGAARAVVRRPADFGA